MPGFSGVVWNFAFTLDFKLKNDVKIEKSTYMVDYALSPAFWMRFHTGTKKENEKSYTCPMLFLYDPGLKLPLGLPPRSVVGARGAILR